MAKPKINLSANAEPTPEELAELTPTTPATAGATRRTRGRPRKNLTTTPAPLVEPEISVDDSAVTVETMPVATPAPEPEPMSEEERELRKILAEMAAKRAAKEIQPDPEPVVTTLEETDPEPILQVDLNVKFKLPAQITADQTELYQAAQKALTEMAKFLALATQLEATPSSQATQAEAVEE